MKNIELEDHILRRFARNRREILSDDDDNVSAVSNVRYYDTGAQLFLGGYHGIRILGEVY